MICIDLSNKHNSKNILKVPELSLTLLPKNCIIQKNVSILKLRLIAVQCENVSYCAMITISIMAFIASTVPRKRTILEVDEILDTTPGTVKETANSKKERLMRDSNPEDSATMDSSSND